MDKETYIQWNTKPLKTNAFESVLPRWMNREPIKQRSQVRKKKTNILYSHIYRESRRVVLINLFSGQQWRHSPREKTCGHNGGRRRWINSEKHGNTYVTICKIDSQWRYAVWCREPKSGAPWQPRGMRWGGRWGGGLRLLMNGTNQHNIVK